MSAPEWLEILRGDAPLIVSMPHTGLLFPQICARNLENMQRAVRDADWHVEKLYDFAPALGATTVRTTLSRTVIDVNRDPSGASLYPGQATTELCPLTTFDGDPLYLPGGEPGEEEIAARREAFFDPYHAALAGEIERLRAKHGHVVLYEAHSIRSVIPRLFEGELPHFNIGTNDGKTCDSTLTTTVETVCESTPYSRITNGRFKGGWTTRHYGQPDKGVHAIQMELAYRGYLNETTDEEPPVYEETFAAPMRAALKDILTACLDFAKARP